MFCRHADHAINLAVDSFSHIRDSMEFGKKYLKILLVDIDTGLMVLYNFFTIKGIENAYAAIKTEKHIAKE